MGASHCLEGDCRSRAMEGAVECKRRAVRSIRIVKVNSIPAVQLITEPSSIRSPLAATQKCEGGLGNYEIAIHPKRIWHSSVTRPPFHRFEQGRRGTTSDHR